MIARAALAASSVLIAFPSVSSAQEMRPLVDAMANAAEPYIPARCGAMYQAMMEWTGETRLGAEAWAAMGNARERFIYAAAVLAQERSGGTLDASASATIRDVRNIADLYIERLEANYALTGQAFAEDSLIRSDLQFCQMLAEGSTER